MANYHQQTGNTKTDSPQIFFKQSIFRSEWITNGADADLPIFADKIGKYMAEQGLTNTKIRSFYCEMIRIQMSGYDREKSSFFLLKPKVAYALGREPKNKGLEMFKIVYDTASSQVKDHTSYSNFCALMEAILAYHKANGGK